MFWAIRGGGGNFGVGDRVHVPAPSGLHHRRRPHILVARGGGDRVALVPALAAKGGPEDIYAFFAFATVPPVPPFPEHLHMEKVCGLDLVLLRTDRAGRRGLRTRP